MCIGRGAALTSAMGRNASAPGITSPGARRAQSCLARSRLARRRVAHLKLTPHSVRHGGASADVFLEARGIDEVQSRGRWALPSGCARYKKPGTYHRMVQRMGPDIIHIFHHEVEKGLLRILKRETSTVGYGYGKWAHAGSSGVRVMATRSMATAGMGLRQPR